MVLASIDLPRAVSLADRAERTVIRVTDSYWRPRALAEVAQVLMDTVPARAARLADNAQRAAEGIVDSRLRGLALTEIHRALLSTEEETVPVAISHQVR